MLLITVCLESARQLTLDLDLYTDEKLIKPYNLFSLFFIFERRLAPNQIKQESSGREVKKFLFFFLNIPEKIFIL